MHFNYFRISQSVAEAGIMGLVVCFCLVFWACSSPRACSSSLVLSTSLSLFTILATKHAWATKHARIVMRLADLDVLVRLIKVWGSESTG